MTESQAEYLLGNYPALWSVMQDRHELIIHGYRACGSFAGEGRRGSEYSDQTASKAIKLIELDDKSALLSNVSEWIDNGLEPHNRGLLIERWRGDPWQSIAHKRGGNVWQVMNQWKSLIQSLMKYQIAFVGHVRE